MTPTLLYCIGAQKAGTTWLFEQLRAHPDAFLALPKELHYWDCIRAPFFLQFRLDAQRRLGVGPGLRQPGIAGLLRQFQQRTRDREATADRYRAIYESGPFSHAAYLDYVGANRQDKKLVADVTPSYMLLSRDVFADMVASHADTRFVLIMRDPVARLWSGVKQRYRGQIKAGQMSQPDLERAFSEACTSDRHPDALRSDYRRTIRELEASVPADRVHCCFFETLLDPAAGQAERDALARFIGLPDIAWQVAAVTHRGVASEPLSPALSVVAAARLAPVYDFVTARFGPRVPAQWANGRASNPSLTGATA